MRHEKHESIIYKEESYAIQGAVFEVYREMGCGFLIGISRMLGEGNDKQESSIYFATGSKVVLQR